MPDSDQPTIKVDARAPFSVYFKGDALSLSAINKVGKFDILPGHADFFSMLSPGEIIIHNTDGKVTKFEIKTGIITVSNNEVMLFCNM